MKKGEPGNSLSFHQEARDMEPNTLDLGLGQPKGDEKILCPKCGYDMTLRFEVWYVKKEIKNLMREIKDLMENMKRRDEK